ncbi:MAG: hypothetical protein AAFX05_07505 [Planctomycetota bacterium]
MLGTGGVSAVVVLAACSTPVTFSPPPPPDVSRLSDPWEEINSYMGFRAVLPPTEDLRVGDVYLDISRPVPLGEDGEPTFVGFDPHRSSLFADAIRWSAVSVLGALTEEYGMRPGFPPTPNEYADLRREDPEDWSSVWPEAMTEPESIFEFDDAPSRLRQVSLGVFSSMTYSSGNLQRLIPVEAVNLALGTAWSDPKAVTLRISSAESYSLSLARMLDELCEDDVSDGGRPVLRSEHLGRLDALTRPGDRVTMHVVTGVVFARTVDFAIQAQAPYTPDAGVTAEEFAVEKDEQQEGPEMEDEYVAPTTEPEPVELDKPFAAYLRAQELNQLLADSDIDDVPGVLTRFISVTDDSVSLRRIWQRGIAVAARTIALEVDPSTGEILDMFIAEGGS